MNHQWIDVSAQVKTYGDLRPGDLVLSHEGWLRFRVLGDTAMGELSYVTRNGVPGHIAKHHKFTDLGGVLRRWDRLEKLPYTVELCYDSDTGIGTQDEVWRGFVEVEARDSNKWEVTEAIKQAQNQCVVDNGWTPDMQMPRLDVVCVMRGHVWQEEIP